MAASRFKRRILFPAVLYFDKIQHIEAKLLHDEITRRSQTQEGMWAEISAKAHRKRGPIA